MSKRSRGRGKGNAEKMQDEEDGLHCGDYGSDSDVRRCTGREAPPKKKTKKTNQQKTRREMAGQPIKRTAHRNPNASVFSVNPQVAACINLSAMCAADDVQPEYWEVVLEAMRMPSEIANYDYLYSQLPYNPKIIKQLELDYLRNPDEWDWEIPKFRLTSTKDGNQDLATMNTHTVSSWDKFKKSHDENLTLDRNGKKRKSRVVPSHMWTPHWSRGANFKKAIWIANSHLSREDANELSEALMKEHCKSEEEFMGFIKKYIAQKRRNEAFEQLTDLKRKLDGKGWFKGKNPDRIHDRIRSICCNLGLYKKVKGISQVPKKPRTIFEHLQKWYSQLPMSSPKRDDYKYITELEMPLTDDEKLVELRKGTTKKKTNDSVATPTTTSTENKTSQSSTSQSPSSSTPATTSATANPSSNGGGGTSNSTTNAPPKKASTGEDMTSELMTGTKRTPYRVTYAIDSDPKNPDAIGIQSITGMVEYKEKCFEELRWEDYRIAVGTEPSTSDALLLLASVSDSEKNPTDAEGGDVTLTSESTTTQKEKGKETNTSTEASNPSSTSTLDTNDKEKNTVNNTTAIDGGDVTPTSESTTTQHEKEKETSTETSNPSSTSTLDTNDKEKNTVNNTTAIDGTDKETLGVEDNKTGDVDTGTNSTTPKESTPTKLRQTPQSSVPRTTPNTGATSNNEERCRPAPMHPISRSKPATSFVRNAKQWLDDVNVIDLTGDDDGAISKRQELSTGMVKAAEVANNTVRGLKLKDGVNKVSVKSFELEGIDQAWKAVADKKFKLIHSLVETMEQVYEVESTDPGRLNKDLRAKYVQKSAKSAGFLGDDSVHGKHLAECAKLFLSRTTHTLFIPVMAVLGFMLDPDVAGDKIVKNYTKAMQAINNGTTYSETDKEVLKRVVKAVAGVEGPAYH